MALLRLIRSDGREPHLDRPVEARILPGQVDRWPSLERGWLPVLACHRDDAHIWLPTPSDRPLLVPRSACELRFLPRRGAREGPATP